MTDELPDEQLEDLHAKREQLLARLHAVQARGRYAHEKSWGTLREERMVEGLQVLEGKMLWELRGLDQRIRDLAAKADATFTERDFIFKGEWDWFMGRVREFWNGLPREEDSRRVLRLFAHGAPVAVIDQLQTVAPGRIRLRVRSPEAAPAVEKFWAALRRNADILEEIEVTVLAPVWTFSGGWDYFVKDWRAAAAQVDLSCWLDKERDELTMDTPTGREATLTAGARTDAATQLYWEVAAHDWAVMNGKDGKVAAIVAMLRRRGWVVDTPTGEQAEPPTHAGKQSPAQVQNLDPLGLTQRELEVALLCIQGLTAAQTATELVLSKKTVDRHIANIGIKLKAYFGWSPDTNLQNNIRRLLVNIHKGM